MTLNVESMVTAVELALVPHRDLNIAYVQYWMRNALRCGAALRNNFLERGLRSSPRLENKKTIIALIS